METFVHATVYHVTRRTMERTGHVQRIEMLWDSTRDSNASIAGTKLSAGDDSGIKAAAFSRLHPN